MLSGAWRNRNQAPISGHSSLGSLGVASQGKRQGSESHCRWRQVTGMAGWPIPEPSLGDALGCRHEDLAFGRDMLWRG
jgi:hypothetical protein